MNLRVAFSEVTLEQIRLLSDDAGLEFYFDYVGAQRRGDASIPTVFPNMELELILEEE